MPYWIADTLAGTPAFLWIYAGLGIPWALVLLPRADWRRWVEVLAVAFATGPALLTAYMFALTTLDVRFEWDVVSWGTVILALIGAGLAWRRWRDLVPSTEPEKPLAVDEILLIALIVVALVVRWIVIAYWNFTAYDALWVYGYQGRLFTLIGRIPETVGYYPQFMPLQYTYVQLAFGINDHIARAGLIFLHTGSIFAAHVLGARLFNRRTGIILAALWALYPHLGEWSRAGDLEIPLAFLFTLAAAYFLTAWTKLNRRYALIAGWLLGIGMWIKPTMGAFILGVVLMVVIDLLRVRLKVERWLPRLEIAILAGAATLPLGVVWYVRNVLLGHSPIDFPPGYWQTLAAQSGVEFGWLLVALIAVLVYVYARGMRPPRLPILFGTALVLAAVLPTLVPYWATALSTSIETLSETLAPLVEVPRRMNLLEWAALIAGGALVAWALSRVQPDEKTRTAARILGWSAALALPYVVVWFFFYSYHYRLSFAVAPLLILPTAAILAELIQPERMRSALRVVYLALIVVLALPGIISAVYDPNGGWDYLWTDVYPDDDARYRSGNAALMNVVDGLQVWLDEYPNEELIVSAPGIERLPFFFPLETIRVDDVPTQLNEIDDARYFVYGLPETRGAYEGIPITRNQVVGALGRKDIIRRAWGHDDGIFRYDVYELNLANRWTDPQPHASAPQDAVFDGMVRYLGHDIGGAEFWRGRRLIAHLFWEVLEQPQADLSVFIHLRDSDDNLITTWDGPIALGERGYYSSLVWEPGEFISDERVFQLPDDVTATGSGYKIVIGLYDPLTNQRLPLTLGGVPAGDELVMTDGIELIAEPPE